MTQDKPQVLIVDDKPENLYALAKLLAKLDVQVLQALSGAAALNLALEHDFCVAIVDIQMPEMDGYELVELLRSNKVTAALPAIFVSAIYSDEYHYRKGYEAGAVDFMSKPFVPEILLSKVKVFIDLYQQRKALEEEIHQRRQAEAALQQANLILSKRAVQLETSSQVGQQVTSILDPDDLLDKVVKLIQARFGYYFVGAWLLNEGQDAITLRSSRQRNREHPLDLTIPLDSPRSIIVSVCRSGQYHLANDVGTDSAYLAVQELTDTRSELALPLRLGGKLIGVLDIQSEQAGAFGSEDISVLQTLADQITISIRNAQLYNSEKQRRQLAESLEHIGRVLASSLDMAEVPSRILEQLDTVVPYARGAVLLQERDTMRVIAQRGFSEQWAAGAAIPIQPGSVFQQIVETRCPVLIDDVTVTPAWHQMDGLPINRSWLGVPLMSKDQVMGLVSLTRREAARFTPEDVTLVAAFAGQAAVALENASLYDRITRFNEELEQVVQQRTEELESAYQALERVDKIKSDFITVTAHELRTPLTLIKGYADLLRPKVNDIPEAHPLIEGILTGESRLLEVVNSMLDISRIDSQALGVCKEPLHLSEIIGGIRGEHRAVLDERRLTLTVTGLDLLPTIQADPDLMFKLFDHLISNAIKYTPDSGSIVVSGRRLSTDHSEQGLEAVEILVRDTGVGIDPAHHELIFEKFYQTGPVRLHSSGKTKFKGGGPGLGLAIARGIVQAHGGRIWVESPGYDEKTCPGSSFHVLLPVSE